MSEETALRLLQDLDENKVASLDNLSSKFLKNGATVLAKPILQICNLSIKYSIFPSDCKILKLKPLFTKRSEKSPQKISYNILTSLCLLNIWESYSWSNAKFSRQNWFYLPFRSGFRKFFHWLMSTLLSDTRREKTRSNKTLTLWKSTNRNIWVVGTSNQLFIRGF